MTLTLQETDIRRIRITVNADLGRNVHPSELLTAVSAPLEVIRVQMAANSLGQLIRRISRPLEAQQSHQDLSLMILREVASAGLVTVVNPQSLASIVQNCFYGEEDYDSRSANRGLAEHIDHSIGAIQQLLNEADNQIVINRVTFRNPLELMVLVSAGVSTIASIEWIIRKWQGVHARKLDIDLKRLEIRRQESEMTQAENRQRDTITNNLAMGRQEGELRALPDILMQATLDVAIDGDVSPDHSLILQGSLALRRMPTELVIRLED